MRQRLVLFLLMLCGSLVEARDLPDFTGLVEEHSASVVNISTVRNLEGRQPRGEVSALIRPSMQGMTCTGTSCRCSAR